MAENNSNWSTGVGSQILGMLGGMFGAGSQHRRQKELMDIQFLNQQALNRQGHDLQFDMWKKTSFPAQVRMMKEAGLNPALMFQGGAGGGGTTGSQGGGSATGGSASPFQVMDMQNILLGKEAKEIDSRIDLNNAKRDDLLGETRESEARIKEIFANISN